MYTKKRVLKSIKYNAIANSIDLEFVHYFEDEQGNELESSVIYFYFAYIAEGEAGGIPWMMLLGGCIGGLVALIIVMKLKRIRFDDYVYLKKWRVFPFFKPLVVGPVSVNIAHPGATKAEFYVDGALQATETQAPFLWRWNKPSFSSHTIETKITDEQGKTISSGAMDVMVINPFSNPRDLFNKEASP